MMKKLKMVGLLSGLCLLSACGKTVPTQDEVRTRFLEALTASQKDLNEMTASQKAELMHTTEEEMKLSNLKCHEVRGMDKVYRCDMLLSGNKEEEGGTEKVSAQFVRKNDGSLVMDESSFNVK